MEENQSTIYVKTESEEFNLKGRPCELSAFSFVPPSRNLPPERNIFNSSSQVRFEFYMHDL